MDRTSLRQLGERDFTADYVMTGSQVPAVMPPGAPAQPSQRPAGRS